MDSPNLDDLTALAHYLRAPDIAEMDRLLTEGMEPWLPRMGPQVNAYNSPANFMFYGGAAGGGKVDL